MTDDKLEKQKLAALKKIGNQLEKLNERITDNGEIMLDIANAINSRD